MKYRDHRGGLKESMETEKEFNSIEELKDHIESESDYSEKVDDIKFKYAKYDERTGWNTYLVLVKWELNIDYLPVGWSNDNHF